MKCVEPKSKLTIFANWPDCLLYLQDTELNKQSGKLLERNYDAQTILLRAYENMPLLVTLCFVPTSFCNNSSLRRNLSVGNVEFETSLNLLHSNILL